MQYGSLLWKQGEKQNLKTKSKVADSRFTLSDEVVIDQQKQKEKHIGSLKVGEKMFDFSLFSSWFFFFQSLSQSTTSYKTVPKGENQTRENTRNAQWSRERIHFRVPFARTIFFLFPRRFTVRRIDKVAS